VSARKYPAPLQHIGRALSQVIYSLHSGVQLAYIMCLGSVSDGNLPQVIYYSTPERVGQKSCACRHRPSTCLRDISRPFRVVSARIYPVPLQTHWPRHRSQGIYHYPSGVSADIYPVLGVWYQPENMPQVIYTVPY